MKTLCQLFLKLRLRLSPKKTAAPRMAASPPMRVERHIQQDLPLRFE